MGPILTAPEPTQGEEGGAEGQEEKEKGQRFHTGTYFPICLMAVSAQFISCLQSEDDRGAINRQYSDIELKRKF